MCYEKEKNYLLYLTLFTVSLVISNVKSKFSSQNLLVAHLSENVDKVRTWENLTVEELNYQL